MKAKATAAPAKLRPAWTAEAAPVASGRRLVVALPVAMGRSEAGTVKAPVGWMTVPLWARPVLATRVVGTLVGYGAGVETSLLAEAWTGLATG